MSPSRLKTKVGEMLVLGLEHVEKIVYSLDIKVMRTITKENTDDIYNLFFFFSHILARLLHSLDLFYFPSLNVQSDGYYYDRVIPSSLSPE